MLTTGPIDPFGELEDFKIVGFFLVLALMGLALIFAGGCGPAHRCKRVHVPHRPHVEVMRR